MRELVGIYELIGGITTLAMLFLSFSISIDHSSPMSQLSWDTTVIAAIIIKLCFGLCLTLSGLMLIKNTRYSYALSCIIQFVQMIVIQTPNFHHEFYAPIGLSVTFGIPGLNYIFGIGSFCNFSFSEQPVDATYLGFNFISLVLFIFLLMSSHKTNNEIQMKTYSTKKDHIIEFFTLKNIALITVALTILFLLHIRFYTLVMMASSLALFIGKLLFQDFNKNRSA